MGTLFPEPPESLGSTEHSLGNTSRWGVADLGSSHPRPRRNQQVPESLGPSVFWVEDQHSGVALCQPPAIPLFFWASTPSCGTETKQMPLKPACA